jgi:hypothetical protein
MTTTAIATMRNRGDSVPRPFATVLLAERLLWAALVAVNSATLPVVVAVDVHRVVVV